MLSPLTLAEVSSRRRCEFEQAHDDPLRECRYEFWTRERIRNEALFLFSRKRVCVRVWTDGGKHESACSLLVRLDGLDAQNGCTIAIAPVLP